MTTFITFQPAKLAQNLFVLTLLGLAFSSQSFANTDENLAVLESIQIEVMQEGDPIKTYVDYKQANVTRNGLDKKDIPQTIETIDVSKYKLYGANDLSVMLQGTAGISTNYDMRGDGISIRGFSADSGDIYRDGIRESGQVRRSTANVERIEILKGPASVLYGRSSGGGVINMVSKSANFDSTSSFGAYLGSYENVGGTFDINKVLSDKVAVRVTGEKYDTNSFRKGIGSKLTMVSPSITYRNDDRTLNWTTQFTYDKLERVPDRSPNYENMPKNVSRDMGFAHPKDFVHDELKVLRTDLKYEYLPNWKFHWALSHRQASQNFDHFYLGTYCSTANSVSTAQLRTQGSCNNHIGEISQVYYWQQTANKTTSNTFDITGEFFTGGIKHNLLVGTDWVYEQREPRLANQNAQGQVITGYLNPYTGAYSENHRDGTLKINTHNYNQGTNYGIFLQDLISFNEQYKLMLGLRYDYFDYKTTNRLRNTSWSNSDSTFSPNIGFVYQPIPAHSLYASYSRSFAPFGGNMGLSMSEDDLSREPQESTQYEIGVKSDWLNQRLNTQLSAYHINKENVRGSSNPLVPRSPSMVIGDQVSKGVEFSFIGKALDNVYIRGGYGYNHASLKRDLRTAVNYTGNQLANTSKHTGNLFVRYIPTEQWYGEVGLTHVGDFYSNDSNAPNTKIDGFTRLDGAIGFKNDDWSITLSGNNLTDKKYWRSGAMPGTPRNYLLRVNYLF